MPVHPIVKQKWPVKLVHLQLCTQIIEKNANPEWNQLLNLQVKVRTRHEQKWAKQMKDYNFVFSALWLMFVFLSFLVSIDVWASQTDCLWLVRQPRCQSACCYWSLKSSSRVFVFWFWELWVVCVFAQDFCATINHTRSVQSCAGPSLPFWPLVGSVGRSTWQILWMLLIY